MRGPCQTLRRWSKAAFAVLLSLFVISCFARAEEPDSRSFFPPNCTVLLVCGVPGDSESEQAYGEQLKTWLELADQSANVQRVVVLCDEPSAVTVPARFKTKALAADRKNFLGLVSLLGTNSGPLVASVWGHGGNQGSTPVFHVRGPRITPADFSSVATAMTNESHWVCLFRGSGLFAKAIAGEHRLVLSSDREGVFTSDPVGMAVLLKLLRKEPGDSFEHVSEEFGQGTAAWYEQRHLARTEEPTFWAGTSEARLLARATEEQAGSSSGTNAVVAEEAKGSSATGTSTNSAKELAGYWRELKRVKAADFPESEGVILKQSISCALGRAPAVVREQEEFIQVLTAEGKGLGDFDIAYSPPDEDIEFLDCEVLRPDGQLLQLDPDEISESSQANVGDYRTGRRKFFSLPGVVPGAILHVRYRTQWQRFPLPQISMELPLATDLPALGTAVEVRVASNSAFHFAFEDIAAPDPEVKQSTYTTTYTWKFERVAARQHEVLMSPRKRARLLVSTFPDWKSFAEWYGRLSQLTDEVTPAIAAKAKELTAGAKTDPERVLAIYNYVTSLRYVAIPLGVNSFRPHAAANVLKNQYGDCKDKANLFNAFLHALNIPAHLVLVPRFSQAHEDIPGLAFNHAISRATINGQALWVDTTDDVCRFGLLPPGDPGRNVLVIDGQTSVLTSLPAPRAEDNRLELKGRATCSGFGQATEMSLSAAAFGYPDYELRNAAQESRQRRGALPLLNYRYRPAAGTFALGKQTATAVSALQETFSWQAEGTCVGLSSRSGAAGVLHSPFWLPKEWDAALQERESPLYLNQGYPLMLEEQFEIGLPASTKATDLPPSSESQEGPLRWRLEWTKVGDDKVQARFHAEVQQGELSEADTKQFQQQLRELLAQLGADASFSLKP